MILKLKNTPLFLGRGILVTVVVSLFAAYAADDDSNQDNQGTRRSISSEDSDDEEKDHKNSIATRTWEKIPTIPTSWKRQAFYGGMAACTATFVITFVIYDISRFFDLPSCPESMSTDLVREITRGSIGGGTPIIYFDGSSVVSRPTLPTELEGLSIVGSRKAFIERSSNSSYFNLTQEEYRPAEFRPHAATSVHLLLHPSWE